MIFRVEHRESGIYNKQLEDDDSDHSHLANCQVNKPCRPQIRLNFRFRVGNLKGNGGEGGGGGAKGCVVFG